MRSTRPDDTLHAARARRMLEDTAVAAVGGGNLVRLDLDAGPDGSWEAEVRRGDGLRLRLRLHPEHGTVVLQPIAADARVRQVA